MRRKLTVQIALCALLVSAICSAVTQVRAAGDLNRTYDWTVNLQTEELTRCFNYKNSALSPLDKITVDYYPGEDDKSTVHYEKLWYHKGQPLGLERLQALGLTQGENICVNVTHKTGQGTPDERKAAANAILQVWLDALVNKNQLVVVKVPAQSLQPITDELVRKQKFIIVPDNANVEDAVDTTMNLLLVSEQDGTQVKLAYK